MLTKLRANISALFRRMGEIIVGDIKFYEISAFFIYNGIEPCNYILRKVPKKEINFVFDLRYTLI